MNLSGWDFLWLLNEVLAVWPLTLQPRNWISESAKSLLSNHTNLTATVYVKKPNRVRVVWTSPPTSPASPLFLWQELQTNNGVTPEAQLNQALQRKLHCGSKRSVTNSRWKTPQRVIEQRHNLQLRKEYLQKPKRLQRKNTVLMSVTC